MENVHVKRAMNFCVGPIRDAHDGSGIQGVLLLCLASMVHHSIFLKSLIAENPAHSLGQIPLWICWPNYKKQWPWHLKQMCPTGVPPHVNHAVQLRKALDVLGTSIIELMRNQPSALFTAVQDAIRFNDLRSGSLILHTLQEHLDEHQEQVKQTIHEPLDGIHINACRRNDASSAASVTAPEDEDGMHYYDSKLLCV
jgi:hypothetical protein